jgi:hypothetical protein
MHSDCQQTASSYPTKCIQTPATLLPDRHWGYAAWVNPGCNATAGAGWLLVATSRVGHVEGGASPGANLLSTARAIGAATGFAANTLPHLTVVHRTLDTLALVTTSPGFAHADGRPSKCSLEIHAASQHLSATRSFYFHCSEAGIPVQMQSLVEQLSLCCQHSR